MGTHVFNYTHELNSCKNVGTHVLSFTHEHLLVFCSVQNVASQGYTLAYRYECVPY
jgi:hypothetical protein